MFWSFPLSARPLSPFAEATPHVQEMEVFDSPEDGILTRAGTIVHLDLRRPGLRARLASISGPVGLTLMQRNLDDRVLVDEIAALARIIPVGLSLYRPDDISAVERMSDVVAVDIDYCDALEPLASLSKLEALHVESASVGVKILRRLAGCPLRQLSLYFCKVRSIEAIGAMPRLAALRLRSIASAELRHLAGLEQLEHLELAFERLDAGHLDHLRPLTRLTNLTIETNRLTGARGEGLAPLVNLVKLSLDCEQTPRNDLIGPLVLPSLRDLALGSWPAPWKVLEQLTAPALRSLTVFADRGDRELTWVARFPAIERLWLPDARTASLGELRKLTALRDLSLHGSNKLTDLAPLADLPLTALDVSDTSIGDDGARPLATMRALRRVGLGSTRVTDAVASTLASLTQLETLDLGSTGIGDVTLATIAELSSLRELDLSRTRVTDAGIAHLVTLTALEELDLDRTRLSDAAMPHIGALGELRRLSLRDVETLTDEGYRQLENLTHLRSLMLFAPLVTPEAQVRLQARLPRLSIDC